MTVSEYIFNFIASHGSDTVFMVSGSSAMWLTDALKRNDKLKPICNHHEQASAMAAEVYARTTDKLGVALVTVGPGATNAITGLVGAYTDSAPVMIISGQTNSRLLTYEKETLIRQHGTQSVNLEPIVSPLTKYFAVIDDPADTRYHVEQAFYEAMTGRKGPVWIDVPVDIQNKQVPDNMQPFVPSGDPVSQNTISSHTLDQLKELLKVSKRPLILAGHGVRSSNATDTLLEFIHKYNLPIVTSRLGIDLIESSDTLYIGRPGSYGDRPSHFAISNCDLLLVLGSRLSVSTIGYYPKDFAKNATKIMVDIDPKELNKDDVPIDIKINMDCKTFLQQLLENDLSVSDHNDWLKQCQHWKTTYPVVLPEYSTQPVLNTYYFTKKLSEHAKENTHIIVDTGTVCNVVSQAWEIKKDQRYIISGGLSCMGYWAGAIGASIHSQNVIAIAGDGSTQMNIQEFATLKYNNLPLKLFVYNNSGYLLIKHNQHNYMNDRFLGVGLDSGLYMPNFENVAKAYELESLTITSLDDIDPKLEYILTADHPIICQVICQDFQPLAPRIASRVMPDGSLKAAAFDDLCPFLSEEELNANRL